MPDVQNSPWQELLHWMDRPNWTYSRSFLEAHPRLLSDETGQLLEHLIERARAIGDQHGMNIAIEYRQLLAHVRQNGIPAVYDGLELSELLPRLQVPVNSLKETHERVPFLERAVALVSRTENPQLWAQLQGNLGITLAQDLAGDRRANLTRGIVCLQAALEEFRRDTNPTEWAQTQFNLADAYIDLSEQLQGPDRLAAQVHAIDHDGEGRLIYPHHLRKLKTQRALQTVGTHEFAERNWLRAATVLSRALEGFDAIYSSMSARGREWETEAASTLTAEFAYAQVQTGIMEAAVLAACALEQGRARLQTEAVQRQQILAEAAVLLPPDLYARFREVSVALAEALLPGPAQTTEASWRRNSATWPSGSEQLHIADDEFKKTLKAREDYDRVLGEIHVSFPLFGKGADAPHDVLMDAASLLKRHEGLAYVAHTRHGAVALLITHQAAQEGSPVAGAWCDERFTTELIKRGLVRPAGRWLWRRIFQGLLPAQYGAASLDAGVTDAIAAMGMADSIVVQVASACRNLGLQRLVLVPCGLFGLLPLHAAPIVMNIGEPARPLIDFVQVTLAPSARMWALCRRRAARSAAVTKKAALVVGNPLPQPRGLPSLKGAQYESSLVHRVISAETDAQVVQIQREAATRTAVLTELRKGTPALTWIHFACHASANLTEPQRSGVVLAKGERLTARDLLDPARPLFECLRLVVLSACQTAVYGLDLPDEVVGLPAAWLGAGACTVVASLWPVSDAATLALMTKFYELHLIEHLEPSDALWLAQRWLRGLPSWREDFQKAGAVHLARGSDAADHQRRTEKLGSFASSQRLTWNHPVHWAAFIAYGK